jgi:hypothetical protein
MLSRRFMVLQPVLSEPTVPGTRVLKDLTLRQYMALIASADAFVGATSGGSHVAAAFDVPAMVMGWQSLLDPLRFPVTGLSLVHAFLYPQQWHMAAEEMTIASFREQCVERRIEEMLARGRRGRETDIGNHRLAPCGFVPASPRKLVKCGNRFIRVPAPRPR